MRWRKRKGGIDMAYIYGMRLRGFAPLCQPKEGLIERMDSPSKKYYDLLKYNRKLTEQEQWEYELDYLGEELPNNVVG